MEQEKLEVVTFEKRALKTAKSLLKKTADVAVSELSNFFANEAAFAVEVTKDMMEILKDSIKTKEDDYRKYVAMCEDVIKTCNRVLEDGEVTENERIAVLDTVKEVMIRLDDYIKRHEKAKNKNIQTGLIAGAAGLTILGIAKIVADAITKSLKK